MTPATLVSAVTPTFRRPNLVARAVDSALAQTVRDLEVVVVVDGGDRDTLRLLRRTRDARLRVIPVPRRLGPGDSRNHGVAAARGKWIAFLDDDWSLSTDVDWRSSLDWIRANRDLVSGRAYASFLLTWVSVTAAAQQGRWPDFVLLWNEARRGGTPSLLDAVVHVGHWILPPTAYRRLSVLATRNAVE
jgi:glycosyltransferase involved in cell wall biosynthesis